MGTKFCGFGRELNFPDCLRLIYNDKHSSFEELLVKDNSVSVHHKNLQALEMLKVYCKKSSEIMQEVFHVNE